MSILDGIGPELLDVATLLGLLGADGTLDLTWFDNPLARVRQMLTNPSQRAALTKVLDAFLPAAALADLPPGESWHSLLGEQPRGNVYLTIAADAAKATIGIAGRIASVTGTPGAALTIRLPLVVADASGLHAIAGTNDGPLDLALGVDLGSTITAPPVGLRAVTIHAVVAPQASTVATLTGLDLGDGRGPRDVTIDAAHLSADAVPLIMGLVHEVLSRASAATGEVAAVVDHLLPLLGVGDPAIPPLPLPVSRDWFAAMLSSGAGLGHLAGLLGSPDTSVLGSGTTTDPWRVLALPIGTAPGAGVWITATETLAFGVRVVVAPTGAATTVHIVADAILAALPQGGTARAAVLPSASIVLEALGAPALVTSASVTAAAIRGGIRWSAGHLSPLLEIDDITLAGTHYDRIDLTNTDSVVAAASAAVSGAIAAALGTTGPAAHLAALVGLIAPADDPSSPIRVDPAALVANPASAIGAVHRQVLLDPVHTWSHLLPELGALLGLSGAVAGAGTRDDPWRMPIGTAAPLTLDLAAWNAAAKSGDPPQLRVGVQASAAHPPLAFSWMSDVASFELPASGRGAVAIMGGHHASMSIEPGPATASLNVGTWRAAMDWSTRSPMQWSATATNVAFTSRGTTVTVPTIAFPSSASFDVTNPAATAAALGVSVADLEHVLLQAIAEAALAWGGMPAYVLAGLLGLHAGLAGMQADWPMLSDLGASGSLLTDPSTAIRRWLAHVAVDQSTDGSAFLPVALMWFAGFVGNGLPVAPSQLPSVAVTGSGTPRDPWSAPITAQPGAEALVWLEPAGPPVTWAAPIAAQITAATDFTALVGAAQGLAAFDPVIADALDGRGSSALAAALDTLAASLASGDGVVPIASQVPDVTTWTAGTTLSSAHPAHPADPAAVTQIRTQIDDWAGGTAGARVVLLIGPSFSDHTIWSTLVAGTAPNFDFRIPAITPATVDLSGVTVAADFYTADLADDGSGDLTSLTAQIGRVVSRLASLRPGVAVTLVAHSTAGVAARAFTEATPGPIRGVITLGAPHAGAPLPFLTDPAVADALRVVNAIVAGELPTGPMADALAHLTRAIDGVVPASTAGGLAIVTPYPVGSFAGTSSLDSGDRPVLALGSLLATSLFDVVRDALVARATVAPRAAATHLAFGMRQALSLGAAAEGEPQVAASIRADAFRIALSDGAPPPPRPAHALAVRVDMFTGGWLVGGAIADVRVRRATLGVDIVAGSGGVVAVTPMIALSDAAYRAPASATVTLADPSAQALLGAILHSLAAPAPRPASPLATALGFLQALGVAVPDPHGGIGISADALAAIATDAAGYFGPRIGAALTSAGSAIGLTGLVNANPWSVGVQLAALPVGNTATISAAAGVTLPAFAPTLDATLAIGAFRIGWSGGAFTVAAPPWLATSSIAPATLSAALPRVLFSSVTSAVIESVLGGSFRVAPLDTFFADPTAWLARPNALGLKTGGPDPVRVRLVLRAIARALGLPFSGVVNLPGGFALSVTGDGSAAAPAALLVATTAPLGGIATLSLTMAIDQQWHATPGGSVTLTTPVSGSWGAVQVTFATSAAGVTVSVTPQGSSPIQLLPTFSGLGAALAGGAAALLPAALDAIVDALSPAPPLLPLVLDVAAALDLYDAAGKFTAHSIQLRALVQDNWLPAVTPAMRGAAASAMAAVFTGASPLAGTIPGAVAAAGDLVSWTWTLSGGDVGTLSIALGWDAAGPAALVTATGVKPADGAATVSLAAGFAGGTTRATVTLSLALQQALGLGVTPSVTLDGSAGTFTVAVTPLAGSGGAGPLTITLAPALSVTAGPGTASLVAESWLLPLLADVLLEAAQTRLAAPLWPGAPVTLGSALVGAKILASATSTVPVSPLPDPVTMLRGLAAAIAAAAPSLPTNGIAFSIVSDATGVGVRAHGAEGIVRLGAPSGWDSGMDAGVVFYLLNAAGAVAPSLDLAGLGIQLGDGDTPLIDTDAIRIGTFGGYLFLHATFAGGVAVDSVGAGVELGDFGLPLGAATSGNVGGDNPVAASLLRSDGPAGDSNPVNPRTDVAAWFREQPRGAGKLGVRFGDGTDPLWISVHRAFGPIHVDQVGVAHTNDPGVALLVDGSVQVAGLTVQADELGVSIPFRSLRSPSDWSLDLRGLAVSVTEPGVTIAGALIKSVVAGTTEYDGMLLVDVASFGLAAVGSYARPGTGTDQYTSAFVFAAAFIVIGLPPIIEITGLGLGFGYNRRILPPTDLNDVPDFILVAALDDGGVLANDPMGELLKMQPQFPPRRGSMWIAAGLRGTSFVIVHATAVLYVALDRGLEIGLLGVANMALPSDDAALVSLELALKARFSTSEGIFSVQGQLTDHSWMLSQDCQLTGGFAYFMWFPQSQFVLSIGGYNPSFAKPPQFPDVPRLGYHWSLFGAISVKGESYFALTNSCVMAGARFEATYGPSSIHVFFTAYADFLVSWDPFNYSASLGISVGGSVNIDTFLGSVDISVSVGATLTLSGPPLHAEASVDLDVTSFTISFGPDPEHQPQIGSWDDFAVKYLFGGDPNGSALDAHALTGLCPPEPSGGQPAAGTEAQPWKLLNEFSFQTVTSMPARSYRDFVQDTELDPDTPVYDFDIAPAQWTVAASVHGVTLDHKSNGAWVTVAVSGDHFTVAPQIGQVSEATWSYSDPEHVPAAARTLPVLAGLMITGFALTQGQTPLIPIGTLVDASNHRPLPFEPAFDFTSLIAFGVAAESLVALAKSASSAMLTDAAHTVLTGNGAYQNARVNAGLPARGVPPVAGRALLTARSAPPTLTPIATGLTMRPVALPAPPVIATAGPGGVVSLETPRLRTVLVARSQPARDGPPAIHTTVERVTAAMRPAPPRMAPPRIPVVSDMRLVRLAAPTASRPTAQTRPGVARRNFEIGWSASASQSAAFDQAATDVLDSGVTVASGASHIWDIPGGGGSVLTVDGTSAARITCLSRTGTVLHDVEVVAVVSSTIAIPDGTTQCVVTCLGNAGAMAPSAAALGAITSSAAPAGMLAATGWQAANLLAQVGSATYLARGAVVVASDRATRLRARQQTSQSVVAAGEALADQFAMETWLPLGTAVVLLLLDQQDPGAAADGDLTIGARGGTLADPVRVIGGTRKALLYDVTARDSSAEYLAIAVASRAAWAVAGIIGLPGRAQEWAVRMNGGVPEHLVPDGPLTPDGSILVRWRPRS